ncbi:MAG: thiamine pyrophosphate-binding protein [Pseudomonadota bacterium]
MRTGGEILVDCLQAQGVERVFCVPGESYLAVLDALHGREIETVSARQEGGAAMMAEADGKLTGRPGVCLVTRGPGATNAAAGVHVAQQDSTPMVLFVGQVGRRMVGRDAFQEVDYGQMFRGMAKWVAEINHADRIPEVISHAWHVAMAGRPGPVVIALPEDMLARETADVRPGPRVEVADPAPTAAAMAELAELLAAAQRPILVVGGARWDPEAIAVLRRFAEAWQLPVGCSFRRQRLFDHTHPSYAGDVGLGINPALRQRVAEADLLLLLGARFSENPSQGFTLLDIPAPRHQLVHVHPGAEEIGRIYAPRLGINATPGTFLAAAERLVPPEAPPWAGAAAAAHASYRTWSTPKGDGPGALRMGTVMAALAERLPSDAIMTNGAGNYAGWLHRYWRFRGEDTQLAPTSGSMGYGLPAAIAAKRRYPGREVVCFAGDGCLQMTLQEIGTAAQIGADILLLVIDNQSYGTIRMHQERHYPGRVAATHLQNPDFAAVVRAYGGYGATVTADAEVADALAAALAAPGLRLLHLKTDVEAITPSATLTDLRVRTS